MIRTATSPRLAIRTRRKGVTDSAEAARHARGFSSYAVRMGARGRRPPGVQLDAREGSAARLQGVQRGAVQRLELEEELPVLDRVGILDADPAHARLAVG